MRGASHLKSGVVIADGEKYAIIAVSRLPLDAFNLPDAEELTSGLWFAQRIPFSLEQHWRDWIGTVRSDQIRGAQLILVAKAASTAPDVLDEENQRLLALVGRLYQGLLLAGSVWVEGDVVQITGSNCGGTISVRQINNVTAPANTHYGHASLIDIEGLRLAAQLVPVLNGFPAGKYLRLCRVLNAFFSGIQEPDLRERLHQFTRCIEGLIFADAGQTTRQFKSRTELFVGPRQHDLMGALYVNRSAAEHMNDPVLTARDEAQRRAEYLELVVIAESIARGCLNRILLNLTLLPRFEDEAAAASFWSLSETERRSLWGDSMDIDRMRAELRRHARWPSSPPGKIRPNERSM